MPLYEYECDAGHRFEKIQKFSDPPVEKCPTCGKPVHKLMSSPAFQFKGSGWYITDYAKKDAKDTKDRKDTKESTETKESKDSKDTSAKETSAAKTADTSSSTTSTSTSAAKDSSKGT